MLILIWLVLEIILIVVFLNIISWMFFSPFLPPIIAGILALLVPAVFFFLLRIIKKIRNSRKVKRIHENLGPEAPVLKEDGFEYRDLNKNGKLDVYEDPRQPVEARVEDLLNQMTIEEKVGQMFSPHNGISKKSNLKEKPTIIIGVGTSELIHEKKITTFCCQGSRRTPDFVEWHNKLQKLAERGRLGIPVLVCSDPRHELLEADNIFAALTGAKGQSKWPHPTGLAATRDEKLVEEFGNIARQELTAIGIRFALHPMADLATEPRWPRINGTFGEDAELAGKMVAAYIKGFQGGKIGKDSVACCVKHFPGGGPQKNGDDPHCAYGKDQVYPGDNFDYHQGPFKKAFEVGVAAVMPYYGRPLGVKNIEEVGFNFNKDVTTTLLREKYGFQGIVHTDYHIVKPTKMLGLKVFPSMSWGVEHLSTLERAEKALNAGIDVLGGEICIELFLKLVKDGRISKARIDESVRRILKLNFELGLYDNPYLELENALKTRGHPDFVKAGRYAMRKSLVLLKNEVINGKLTLPISRNCKVYIEGFNEEEVAKFATVVKSIDDADFALLRIKTPHRGKIKEIFDIVFNNGDLDFSEKKLKHFNKIMTACPTVIDIYLDRPAVIPELDENAAAIIGNFSAEQDIVLEAIFGEFAPTGKLPFELPRSMEAVRNQFEDVPYDSKEPVYKFGHGLTYE